MASCERRALSNPSSAHPTSRKQHAQGFPAKIGKSRSQKRRSNCALWAITNAASPKDAATSASSMLLPATISSATPVSAVTSGGTVRPGSRRRSNDAAGETKPPSIE
jgi:hypothetical protein